MEKITLLPIGSIEEHGYLPKDTDTLIAKAYCNLVKSDIDCTVEEPINQGFCPTTCLFKNTEVLRFLDVFDIISKKLEQLIEKNRRHIILINIHQTNDAVIAAAIQDIYISRGFPLFYFNPYTAFAKELDKIYFGNHDNSFKECCLLLASLDILGIQPISGSDIDEEMNRDPTVEKLKKAGVLGFAYKKPPQHIAWRTGANADAGHKFLEEMAKRFLPLIECFKEYAEGELAKKK